MRDLLPENGASAVMLPDPQERESEVLAYCACCGAPLYSGEEVPKCLGGERFCDETCAFRWLMKKGDFELVVLTNEGDVIVGKEAV